MQTGIDLELDLTTEFRSDGNAAIRYNSKEMFLDLTLGDEIECDLVIDTSKRKTNKLNSDFIDLTVTNNAEAVESITIDIISDAGPFEMPLPVRDSKSKCPYSFQVH